MDWKSSEIPTVLDHLGVSQVSGLTSAEAATRLEQYGENALVQQAPRSLVLRFLDQFRSALIYILLAAAVVSGVLGEISDAIIIAAIVILNAVVGLVQESRAEQALAALKRMSSPTALVRRDGRVEEVESTQIVPGDIVILEAGRVVPCDLRLIESADLKIEESTLTGESLPVTKDSAVLLDAEGVALGDRVNMAFGSTIVTYGRGLGVAVETGMSTELGRIAAMLEAQEDETTPLQRRLERFGKVLGFVILGLCAVMFGVGILQEALRSGLIPRDSTLELFLTAVSLAVAAIPEGLPAIVTVVLAIGVQQMSRENAIVRRLPAVETLGSITVVCSDKTGTLTQNRMTVTKVAFADGRITKFEDVDRRSVAMNCLLSTLVHCNDATYAPTHSTGDPTEIALLEAGARYGVHQATLSAAETRIAEKPFDSIRKMMTTVGRAAHGATIYTKGALDSILPLCTTILDGETTRPITESDREQINRAAATMADDALRVLAAATRQTAQEKIVIGDLEQDLTFVGLVGMIDPPRLEVRDSIESCKRAGITPVMITGDHQNTAFAIARELGIAADRDQVTSGVELDEMSDEELARRVESLRVFARVSPEHKVRIVTALKERGNLVSMTGDGVNDAPSLKAADIGVAMGITGTDVAKGASDMVLTDDNFRTIVSAIAAGRSIYANIRKAITFLLSCNMGEIIAIFAAILVGWKSPLLPIHILWVNLITDSLPALGLGMEKADPNALRRPPRDPGEGILARGVGFSVAFNGLVIGAATLVAFRLGLSLYPDSLQHARTMAFVVLALSQLFHAFDVRDSRRSALVSLFANKWLWLALGVGAFLQWIVITVPGLAAVFSVYSLSAADWGIATGLAFSPVALNEVVKGIRALVRRAPTSGA